MTDRELMQQALDAMRFALHVGFDESSESQIKKGDKAVRQHEAAITALRERLAQPEREPIKESSATHSHLWIGDLYGKEKNTYSELKNDM